MKPELWFEGVYLLGRFHVLETGCWLLIHNGEAAVLEFPPAGMLEAKPSDVALAAATELGVAVRYLLCTHHHSDHLCERNTLPLLRTVFPEALPVLQEGFRPYLSDEVGVRYFDSEVKLELAGEPLYLIHAPKHCSTDTIVVFRGTACTGDWELGTIRSVHDDKPKMAVPLETKLKSIAKMEAFSQANDYLIHGVYSVHATDKREKVDFPKLMESTREDRVFW